MGISRENKKSSIRAKIIAVILPIVILMIVMISFINYSNSYKIIKKQQDSLMESTNKVKVSEIGYFITDTLSTLASVKNSLENANIETEEELDYLKTTTNKNFPTGIYIGDDKGNFIDPSGWVPPDDYVITDRDWYIEGLANTSFKFGKPYIDAETKEAVISASTLLKSDGDTKRVASVDIAISELVKVVGNTKEKGVVSFIADINTGVILASVNDSLISKKDTTKMTDLASKVVKDNKSSLDGYLTSTAKIDGTSWLFVSCTSQAELNKEIKSLQIKVLIAALMFIVFITLVIEILIRYLLKPLGRLTDVIKSMSNKDFTMDFEVTGNDEISEVSRNLNVYILDMVKTIKDLSNVSTGLVKKAEGSRHISHNLVRSSELQSNSIDSLNSTATELAESASDVAENATKLSLVISRTDEVEKEVSVKMGETVKISEDGKLEMINVTECMQSAASEIKELETIVAEVEGKTGEISSIVSMIQAIAKQSSLIGLNAAIEAARAGEHGKGFAVVATEIQNLSRTSLESVKSVSSLIGEIIELIQKTTIKTEDTVRVIRNSRKLVEETSKTFDVIYDNISKANSSVVEISKSIASVADISTSVAAITEEQSAGAQEMLATSETILSQTESLVSDSEEMDTWSKELKEIADSLGTFVSTYKI